jgi:hypothetical protein
MARLLFDRQRQLYLPESEVKENKRQETQTPAEKQPVVVNVNVPRPAPDWFSRIIAVLTLAVLVAYTIYTRSQWLTMNESIGQNKQLLEQNKELVNTANAQATAARQQAQAAATAATAAIDANKRAAEEAQRASERFREERAAILNVSVITGPTIVLTNTGQTEAADVSIRVAPYEFHGPAETPFSAFRYHPSPVAESLKRLIQPIAPDSPADVQHAVEQSNREILDEIAVEAEYTQVREEFHKWERPDLDFTMQAPTLPPDSAFLRLKHISERRRALEITNLERIQKMSIAQHVGEAIASISSEIEPGTMLKAVGPMGPNTTIRFGLNDTTVTPTEIVDVGGPGGIQIDYVAVRVSYIDHWGKPVTGDNLCFKAQKGTSSPFGLCTKSVMQ